MTTDILAISFVYCPACYGGRKMRLRFKDNNVIEFKRSPTQGTYEAENVEGGTANEEQFNRAWLIASSRMISSWMRGDQLFQGVDFV